MNGSCNYSGLAGIAPRLGFSRLRVFSIILFLCSIVLLVGVTLGYSNKKKQKIRQDVTAFNEIHFWELRSIPALDRQNLLKQSLATIDQFMRETSVGGKAGCVINAVDNISGMTEYYSKHKNELFPGKPELNSISMIEVDGTQVFVVILGFEGEEKWEFTFVRDDVGEWKIDWMQFVRYQSTQWDRFVSGDGPDQGMFRLWVKHDQALDDEKNYCLQFSEPSVNGRSDIGVSCPNIMVPKQSKLGKDIYRMFKINELQNVVYRRVLPLSPSPTHMRVRVILSKKNLPASAGWEYHLDQIVGEGWFDVFHDKVEKAE
ncbi:MAG: hypothetical protein RR719_08360 [Akkermansia sp.]